MFQTLLAFNVLKFQPTNYGSYKFPVSAELAGVVLCLLSVICIPLGALHEVFNNTDNTLSIVQVRSHRNDPKLYSFPWFQVCVAVFRFSGRLSLHSLKSEMDFVLIFVQNRYELSSVRPCSGHANCL